MARQSRHGSSTNPTATNRPETSVLPDEEQPLLGMGKSKFSWRKNLAADVTRDRADVILLLCYIITGLLDSAAISTWGCFVSMQTGKLILHYMYLKILQILLRKHCLHRARLGRTQRVTTLDQIRCSSHILLRWIFLLQPVSPLFHALPALGSLRIIPSTDVLHYRGCGNPNLGSSVSQRERRHWLERSRTYCISRLSELWPGSCK